MAEGILKFLEKFGVNTAIVLAVFGAAAILTVVSIGNVSIERMLAYAIAFSPIWLPVVLFFLFFDKWMDYVKKYFKLEQGRVTLEIILPEEILKSPLAMDLVIAQLNQKASPDNHIQTYWDGKHPPVFGLEIVSHGGTIHFYISTPRKKFKNLIEAQLYSQYPGIEIRELPVDYTAEIDPDLKEFDMFSIHFNKKKDDVLPIKTYVDYKLDTDPKEEFKIDPITQMLDMMAAIGPHERVWVQILIEAHREKGFKEGSLSFKPDWTGRIKKAIDDLAMRDAKRMGPFELEGGGMPRVTEGERFLTTALEKRQGQYAFDTAIRVIYAAKKGHALFGERIGAIITAWNPYNGANGIGLKWRTDYDWNWWQDPKGKKAFAHKKRELDDYKKRVYDKQTSSAEEKVFTAEELATMFHFPGKVALTPTIPRIPSARAEAPANLPIGNF